MNDIDLNTWGIIVVPIGVAICFGIALLVWLREELRCPNGDSPKTKRD
jgi:hypothetical protein